MKRYAKLVARLRVPSGFVVAALYGSFARPNEALLGAGLLVALLGLLLRAWAAGHLAKNLSLATTGPFAYTRNPLYLGTLAAAAGFAVAGRNLWLAAVLLLYFAVVYLPVVGEEESHLCKLFPEYAAYAAQVPRLWPRRSPAFPGGRFQWKLYLRNKEYQALVAYLVVAALLAGKL
ncbi:MAG: isoprenylcysteine carboxylmethyltransferase family protein [Acidobacteria bacterium]|nr:isoprenylcysteine carboxylmethyltransferase family protein [Acidobacteriota bacterium]